MCLGILDWDSDLAKRPGGQEATGFYSPAWREQPEKALFLRHLEFRLEKEKNQ